MIIHLFVYVPHRYLAAGCYLRLLSYLLIELKIHRTCILEISVKFKAYIKAAVLVLVVVYHDSYEVIVTVYCICD